MNLLKLYGEVNMAELPDVFNAKDSEKMTGFEPVPAGWYKAVVTKSEIKKTAAGTGKYINLQWQITEGEHAKRVFWVLLNIVNPNPIAVEIAQKELASICEAMEIDELEDTEDLHDVEIGVKLKVKPGDANWPPKNETQGYKPASEVEVEEEVEVN